MSDLPLGHAPPSGHALARMTALAVLALGAGCEGGGEGQVSGELFLRGCPEQTEAAAPAPFQLDPQFFAADPVSAAAVGPSGSNVDPRIPNRLEIRLQRSSHRPQLTDAFVVYVTDVDALRQRLGSVFPISAAPLATMAAPLPSQEPPYVRAALLLRGTCPLAEVQPQLRGTITWSELGFAPGEWAAADFSLSVDDDRGLREGLAPSELGAAGQLSGRFRVQVRHGRSVMFP